MQMEAYEERRGGDKKVHQRHSLRLKRYYQWNVSDETLQTKRVKKAQGSINIKVCSWHTVGEFRNIKCTFFFIKKIVDKSLKENFILLKQKNI